MAATTPIVAATAAAPAAAKVAENQHDDAWRADAPWKSYKYGNQLPHVSYHPIEAFDLSACDSCFS